MREGKLAAIQDYLEQKFPYNKVEQKHDFDLEAQSFKIHREKSTLLFKVGDLFIDDNDVPEIMRLFALWAVSDVLVREVELGVLVTKQGLATFQRD